MKQLTTSAIAIALALSAQAEWRNIATQASTPPARVSVGAAVIDNPTPAMLYPLGWRIMPAVPAVASNYVRVAGPTAVEGDGTNGAWQVTDRLASEIEAEQAAIAASNAAVAAAARRVAFANHITEAVQFRSLLRSLYPAVESPETDRAYTYERIAGNLVSIALDRSRPSDERLNATTTGIVLQRLYDALAHLSPTGKTWDLPWEICP